MSQGLAGVKGSSEVRNIRKELTATRTFGERKRAGWRWEDVEES